MHAVLTAAFRRTGWAKLVAVDVERCVESEFCLDEVERCSLPDADRLTDEIALFVLLHGVALPVRG